MLVLLARNPFVAFMAIDRLRNVRDDFVTELSCRSPHPETMTDDKSRTSSVTRRFTDGLKMSAGVCSHCPV